MGSTTRFLTREGMAVIAAESGEAGLTELERVGADLVLLDVMMPTLDGAATYRRLRTSSTVPVIFLTARGEVEDRLRGLSLGADDYIGKPADPREVAARIRAVVRRVAGAAPGEIAAGDVVVRLRARRLHIGGAEVFDLTALELDLMAVFVREGGRPVPRERIRALAGRGDTAVSDRALDVHVSNLRRKLGGFSARLKTVRGVGYVWLTQNAE